MISEFKNTNITKKISQMFADKQIMNPKISCEIVNCRFNHNKLCNAKKLNILGSYSSSADETECQTFDPG